MGCMVRGVKGYDGKVCIYVSTGDERVICNVYYMYTLYIFFTHLQAAYKCVWSVFIKRCILASEKHVASLLRNAGD